VSTSTEFALPGRRVFPEGIAADQRSGDFYVSSYQDGTIFRGNVHESSKRLRVFLRGGRDGREHALGLDLDPRGHLFVAGDVTGLGFEYEVSSRRLIRRFDNRRHRTNDLCFVCKTMAMTTMINDVAVAPSGDAFFTDSIQPTLWRAPSDHPPSSRTLVPFEPWLPFCGTGITYRYGKSLPECLNLNGIVVTGDGVYLLTIQSNTGELFRIEIETKQVTTVEVRGGALTGGDGLVLDGQLLYVIGAVGAERQPIVAVRLDEKWVSGDVEHITKRLSLQTPTTAALLGNDLLVVNSQFDKLDRKPGLPFTVSKVARLRSIPRHL
jgi:sugar lactone lactonase YvrE